MAALLVAAFTAVNALSLAHMALIAVGMAAPPAARRATWRLVALPLLGALLLAQFTVLIGLPPGVGELLGSGAWTGPCAGPLHAGGGCGAAAGRTLAVGTRARVRLCRRAPQCRSGRRPRAGSYERLGPVLRHMRVHAGPPRQASNLQRSGLQTRQPEVIMMSEVL